MELNIQEQLTYKEQVNRFYDYIKLDLDNEYYKLLEIAIECGMTSAEFWNGDIVMFAIFSNSYTNRLHKQAFVNGVYFDTSLQTEISNVFLKKGEKPRMYPSTDIFNPLNIRKQEQDLRQHIQKDVLDNRSLYYDSSKAFHIKAILNSRRKEDK